MPGKRLLLVPFMGLLSVCADRKPDAIAEEQRAGRPTDRWLGAWTGPEGTSLRVAADNGKYTITIRSLDGSRTFGGLADGERITFDRNGVQESIHATDGVGTGMKWLREKTTCLTVRVGEGYCRDQ